MTEDRLSVRVWAFNRRVVADQTIYVAAATRSEAWRKARGDHAFGTSDEAIVQVSYRRLPESDDEANLPKGPAHEA